VERAKQLRLSIAGAALFSGPLPAPKRKSRPAICRAESTAVESEWSRVHAFRFHPMEKTTMAENVYNVIELIGTSAESWEKAAKVALERAAKTLRDLRVAEIVERDVQLNNGKVEAYRVKMKVSFKHEG
jgi:flavin-binding protein dodecin